MRIHVELWMPYFFINVQIKSINVKYAFFLFIHWYVKCQWTQFVSKKKCIKSAMQQSFLNHVSFFFHFTISSTCTCILSFLIITINHNSTEYASPFLYHVTVQAFRIQITRWSKMSVICYRRYNQEYIRSLCLYRFFQRFTC